MCLIYVPICIEEDRSNKNIIFNIYALSRASIIRYLLDLPLIIPFSKTGTLFNSNNNNNIRVS